MTCDESGGGDCHSDDGVGHASSGQAMDLPWLGLAVVSKVDVLSSFLRYGAEQTCEL